MDNISFVNIDYEVPTYPLQKAVNTHHMWLDVIHKIYRQWCCRDKKTTGLNKPKVVWPYIPHEIHKKFIFVHFILYIYCTHLTWCMAPIWPHSGCVCIKNDNTWHSPPSSGSDFNFLALSFQQMNHVFEIVSSLPTTATSHEHFAPNKVYCQFKFNSILFI